MHISARFSLSKIVILMSQMSSLLSFNEDVSIGRIQHCIADELLRHRDGLVHGHAEI